MSNATANAVPAGRPLSLLGKGRDRSIQWSIAIITVVMVAAPLLPIVYQSVIDRPLYDAGQQLTLENFRNLVTGSGLGRILLNTLLYGVLATAMAQVIGFVAAILLARTDVPGRAVLSELMLWPLYISGMVLAIGWITAYGPSGFVTLWLRQTTGQSFWNLYSLFGLSLVTAVGQAPLTFLYCIASARMQDPAIEAAARVAGAKPLRILMSINIPLMMPALVFSATMNFIITIESLALPLIIGGPVGLEFFTTFLYDRGLKEATKDYGLVGAASVFLLAVVVGLLVLQRYLLRRSERFVTVAGKASRPRILALGRMRWVMFALLVGYVILAIGPVIVGVTLRAFTSILTPFAPLVDVLTLANFRTVFSLDVYVRSMVNTLQIAFFGGIIGTVFIALLSIVIQRSNFRLRSELEFVALFPRAIPGIIVGIGAFYAIALLPVFGVLRDTIWILMIVFIMRYIPSGYGAVAPALLQIGKDIDRSARTVGADWWTTVVNITLPLIKPALLSCFAILFVHFIKEYSSAVFLFSPGTEIIGTTMLNFWVQGQLGPVSALALIQIVMTTIFVVAIRTLLGVKIYA